MTDQQINKLEQATRLAEQVAASSDTASRLGALILMRQAHPHFGTVVHQQEETRREETLHENVKKRLGLGINPVQVHEDEEDRLHLGLTKNEAFERVECPLATHLRVEDLPARVLSRDG